MSNASETLTPTWAERTGAPGVTTASILTVMLVATLIGGLMGMVLHGAVAPIRATILGGLLGTVVAGIVRNTLLVRVWSAAGVEDVGTPISVIISAAVASLAGSLAAHELISNVGPIWSGVTGMLAGLLSSGLMALLMVVHSLEPRQPAAQA